MKRYIMIIGLVLAGFAVASGQGYSLEERLLDAAERGDLEIVKLLHKQGAAINYQDSEGFTALMWACAGANIELVEYLLDIGANPNIKDIYGYTGLGLVRGRLRFEREKTHHKEDWYIALENKHGKERVELVHREIITTCERVIEILKEAGATE